MKNEIRKAIRSTLEKTTRRNSIRKRRSLAKLRKSALSRWVDRSMDFVSTFPTLNELRDELADWHSFEPLRAGEIQAL